MTNKYDKAMNENYDHDVDSIKENLDQAPEFIKGIDWEMLRKQKLDLLKTISEIDDVERLQSLEGIICLIDNLQDYVCDEIGMPDYMIFGEDELIEQIN